MSGYPYWAVLAPGKPAWLEQHARVALGLDDEEDSEIELPFKIAPGGSHYHALIALDETSVGDEMQIAEELSLECAEPVYAILGYTQSPLVFLYRNGANELQEVEPLELALSLGCPFPESEEPPEQDEHRPLKTAALVEGVLSQEALRILEEEEGHPLAPGRYRFEDTPQGLLITGGTGGLAFADITLSERLPHVTVYGVTASPGLDIFFATLMRGGESIAEFAHPPRYQKTRERPVSELKGERTPERILAALGIPAEWFRP